MRVLMSIAVMASVLFNGDASAQRAPTLRQPEPELLVLSGVDLPPIKRSTRRVSFPIIINEGELHETETIQ